MITKKAKAVENIVRIRQFILEKTISFNQIELECWLDILKNYIDKAMKLQSFVDNLDPENNDRPELEDICVTTKSLFLILRIGNQMCRKRKVSDNHTSLGSKTWNSSSLTENIPIIKILWVCLINWSITIRRWQILKNVIICEKLGQ